jgi:hypothetical protein
LILGGGDRQSHRGSILSLTGWGAVPQATGEGVPSDFTTCCPSNSLPTLSRPLHPPPSPLPSTHSCPSPASCTLCTLPASAHPLPFPGLQFCTNLSSSCLAHSAFASGLQSPLRSRTHCCPCTRGISFLMIHTCCFHTFPRALPLLTLDPCCRHTWDTPSLSLSSCPHALCALSGHT